MIPKIKTIIGVCALGIAAIASCKKPAGTPAIVGKWKLTEVAIDANMNGIMDPAEVEADSSNTVMTFNSNGTATQTDMTGYVATAKWSMLSGNWVKMTDDSIGLTSYSHIDIISSTGLTMRGTSGGYTSWSVFVKQ